MGTVSEFFTSPLFYGSLPSGYDMENDLVLSPFPINKSQAEH